ncbi:MAG: hypothetical protein JNL58_07810 [Planctomyces sp.]|nr:hypothetical protein [Planctomyces sp.]
MNDPTHYRPDPIMPEHQLIREAAFVPSLSKDLRSRVMVQCQSQIRVSRWKQRLTRGGAVMVAAGVLFFLFFRPEPGVSPPVVNGSPQQNLTPPTPNSGYVSPGQLVTPGPSGDLGVPKPDRGPENLVEGVEIPMPTPDERRAPQIEPKGSDEINLIIDELVRRNRRLCGMLLW